MLIGASSGIAVAVVLIFAGVCACVWRLVAWAFGTQAIVCDHSGPIRGLGMSNLLVKGAWWRVFGLFIVFGVGAQFCIELIHTPLSWFAMEPLYSRLMDFNPAHRETFRAQYNALYPVLQSLGWTFGIITALTSGISVLLESVYMTIIYCDYRDQMKSLSFPSHTSPSEPLYP